MQLPFHCCFYCPHPSTVWRFQWAGYRCDWQVLRAKKEKKKTSSLSAQMCHMNQKERHSGSMLHKPYTILNCTRIRFTEEGCLKCRFPGLTPRESAKESGMGLTKILVKEVPPVILMQRFQTTAWETPSYMGRLCRVWGLPDTEGKQLSPDSCLKAVFFSAWSRATVDPVVWSV